MKCQRCGRKVIVVKRNYGSIHQMYFRHGEYITTPESKSEFDFHNPEVEVTK
jgi:hypothetical protein